MRAPAAVSSAVHSALHATDCAALTDTRRLLCAEASEHLSRHLSMPTLADTEISPAAGSPSLSACSAAGSRPRQRTRPQGPHTASAALAGSRPPAAPPGCLHLLPHCTQAACMPHSAHELSLSKRDAPHTACTLLCCAEAHDRLWQLSAKSSRQSCAPGKQAVWTKVSNRRDVLLVRAECYAAATAGSGAADLKLAPAAKAMPSTDCSRMKLFSMTSLRSRHVKSSSGGMWPASDTAQLIA